MFWRRIAQYTFLLVAAFVVLILLVRGPQIKDEKKAEQTTSADAAEPATKPASLLPDADSSEPYREDLLQDELDRGLIRVASDLIRYPTFRDTVTANTTESEAQFQLQMDRVENYVYALTVTFNKKQSAAKLVPFSWQDAAHPSYRVFGYRLGTGPRKITLITHLDTVPPGNYYLWKHPVPRVEKRILDGIEIDGGIVGTILVGPGVVGGQYTDFLVGRGAIDDKGPAAASIAVFRALARLFDYQGTPRDFMQDRLGDVTLTLLFDTSEETDMSMKPYFEAHGAPDMGLVCDAGWGTHAEKGIERPEFEVKLTAAAKPTDSIWVEFIESGSGPVNQIPSSARVRIRAKSRSSLEYLQNGIHALYTFADPGFHASLLSTKLISDGEGGDMLLLEATGSGAQHGSVPQVNRDQGSNPLVSLVNFVAELARSGYVAKNPVAYLAMFASFVWGTHVFGEDHPDLLQRHDLVFEKGNGTTYAVTRFHTLADKAVLKVDVRYGLGHHSVQWDGKTFGTLPGKSTFKHAFGKLVKQFNNIHREAHITFNTRTVYGPDFKDTNSPQFQAVRKAYKEVMGRECPLQAIGGATDAKGFPTLVVAGPKFGGAYSYGPPINLHGVNEGAPIEWLATSARIIYRILVDQVLQAQKKSQTKNQ